MMHPDFSGPRAANPTRALPLVAALAIAVAAGLAGTLTGCGHEAAAARPVAVRVAILPEYSLNVMTARYAPLIESLQRELGPGYRVEWVSCPSPEAYLATVEAEQPVLALQDAYHSALLCRLQQGELLLQMTAADGGGTTSGLIVTGSGSGLTDLRALAGRRLWVPSRKSLLGFRAPAAALERAGLFPEVTFHDARWQDRVAESVRDGRADAGFIEEAALIPGLRVLARTEAFPTGCAVVFPRTAPDLRARIEAALAGRSLDGRMLPGNETGGIFRRLDEPTRAAIAALAGDARALD